MKTTLQNKEKTLTVTVNDMHDSSIESIDKINDGLYRISIKDEIQPTVLNINNNIGVYFNAKVAVIMFDLNINTLFFWEGKVDPGSNTVQYVLTKDTCIRLIDNTMYVYDCEENK